MLTRTTRYVTSRSDGVIKALNLPNNFQVDKFLTKDVDYKEDIVKAPAGRGKYRKVNKITYNFTGNGFEKCNTNCINIFSTTNLNPLPALYLFVVLNNDIIGPPPPNHTIVKYGYSCNLQRRMNEHIKTYGPNIYLKYHVYIDPNFLKDAENEIRSFLHSTKWHFDSLKYSEIAIIPDLLLETVVASEYRRIGQHYLQKVTDMSNRINILEKELGYAKSIMLEKERTINIALKQLENLRN